MGTDLRFLNFVSCCSPSIIHLHTHSQYEILAPITLAYHLVSLEHRQAPGHQPKYPSLNLLLVEMEGEYP